MEFVTLELSKKLKEKGFREEVNAYYDKWGELCEFHPALDMNDSDYKASAPTISQALKWLREEKKIHIGIFPQWQYTVYDMRCNPWIGRSDMQNYDDYTKAVIAGIEYCLDNLI